MIKSRKFILTKPQIFKFHYPGLFSIGANPICFKCLNYFPYEYLDPAHKYGRIGDLLNNIKFLSLLCRQDHIASTWRNVEYSWDWCYDRECAKPANTKKIIFGKPKYIHDECYERLIEAGKI